MTTQRRLKGEREAKARRIQQRMATRGMGFVWAEALAKFALAPYELAGSRMKRHAAARRALVIRLRTMGCSYPEIGELLEMDHTSARWHATKGTNNEEHK